MSKSLFRLHMSIPIIRNSSYKKSQLDYSTMEPRYDYNRKWKTLTSKTKANPLASFKLLSYNILAQDLLLEHLNLYVNNKQQWLSWRLRLENIQREILKLDPDILCLQEMQYNHLPLLVQRLTECSGKRLEYIYKKKTGSRTDGCAIIYDSCKFQLLGQHGVELYDPDVPLLNRENVALLAKFRLKQVKTSTRELIVATTHLLFNPRRNDVRCAQVTKLLTELQNFLSQEEEQPPVILTGDFNCEADSEPIGLLTANNKTDTINFEALDPGECTASTYLNNWITVDYIMRSVYPQSKQKLQALSVYSLPAINSCANVGRIPNHYLGSDHYAMGAIFAFV